MYQPAGVRWRGSRSDVCIPYAVSVAATERASLRCGPSVCRGYFVTTVSFCRDETADQTCELYRYAVEWFDAAFGTAHRHGPVDGGDDERGDAVCVESVAPWSRSNAVRIAVQFRRRKPRCVAVHPPARGPPRQQQEPGIQHQNHCPASDRLTNAADQITTQTPNRLRLPIRRPLQFKRLGPIDDRRSIPLSLL